MTETPHTADELLDAWAGTVGPHEPSPTIHPSLLPQDDAAIVRHAYLNVQVCRRGDGAWEIRDDPKTWAVVVADETLAFGVFKAITVGQMRCQPRAENPGATPADTVDGGGDPLGVVVGLMWALPLGVGAWVGLIALARWRGWL